MVSESAGVRREESPEEAARFPSPEMLELTVGRAVTGLRALGGGLAQRSAKAGGTVHGANLPAVHQPTTKGTGTESKP